MQACCRLSSCTILPQRTIPAALIGDSQGLGNTLPSYADAFHNQMEWRMGLPDMVPCCIGGTGFVATDGGLSTNYIRHALSDLAIINAHLRKAAERTVSGLWDAIGRLIDLFSPQECANFFAAAGYDAI